MFDFDFWARVPLVCGALTGYLNDIGELRKHRLPELSASGAVDVPESEPELLQHFAYDAVGFEVQLPARRVVWKNSGAVGIEPP
jgi:hypothetical protein